MLILSLGGVCGATVMVKQKILYFVCMCLFLVGASGCAVTNKFGPYYGKVIDAETEEPIADAERAFLIALGGGCNLPIAAYAVATDKDITIDGIFATEDGKYFEPDTTTAQIEDKKDLARTLAHQLKEKVESKKKVVLSDATT